MPRSPLALAALATAAVPGLDAFDVRRSAHPGPGIDAAVVLDAEGRRWVVRAPQDAAAGAALEAEVALLTALVPQVEAGSVPFAVPEPAGFVALPEGGRAVVHPQLAGRPLRLERLGPGPGLAAELGRAIAALHELPSSTVEDAGLPVYGAEEYRRRRLAEVDDAARTGHVPGVLLRRWEEALEDVALWRFQPTVVHGDLSAEHVLCVGDRPVAVLGWAEAKVADPADDLAWLLVAAPQEAVDPILEAYHQRRTELRDPHLATRALLAGELAVARWLLHGVRTDDASVVDDARGMLDELAEHVAAETAEHEAAAVAAAAVAADTDEGWSTAASPWAPEATEPQGEPSPWAPEGASGDVDGGADLAGGGAEGEVEPADGADARADDGDAQADEGSTDEPTADGTPDDAASDDGPSHEETPVDAASDDGPTRADRV